MCGFIQGPGFIGVNSKTGESSIWEGSSGVLFRLQGFGLRVSGSRVSPLNSYITFSAKEAGSI